MVYKISKLNFFFKKLKFYFLKYLNSIINELKCPWETLKCKFGCFSFSPCMYYVYKRGICMVFYLCVYGSYSKELSNMNCS